MALSLEVAQKLKEKLTEQFSAVSDKVTFDIQPLSDNKPDGYGLEIRINRETLWSHAEETFKAADEIAGQKVPKSVFLTGPLELKPWK